MRRLKTLAKKYFNTRCKFLFTLIFIYVALFDFILMPLKIFPRTALIWESFKYLNNNFNFLQKSIITLVAILLTMLVSFFILYLLRNLVIKLLEYSPEFLNNFTLFYYFTPLILIAFVGLFLGNNIISEIIFLLILSFTLFLIALNNAFKNKYEPYILAGKGLGMNPIKIRKNIVWHNLLSLMKNKIRNNYLNIWLYLLIYQFLFASNYLGSILRKLIDYNDIAGFYAFSIFLWIVIFIGNLLISKTVLHFIFWEE